LFKIGGASEKFKIQPKLAHLADTGDAVHLSPGEDGGVPAVPVLVVVPPPLAPPAPQDVQPGPRHRHVPLLVRIGDLDQVRAAARVRAAAGLAAAERPGPDRLAGGTVQRWARLLETVHAQLSRLKLRRSNGGGT